MASLKEKLIKGSLWTMGGQFGTLSLTIVANIWLARILSPSDFGRLGVIMFFIAIANTLTESGLSGALIRKKDASPEDYSTIFIFNLIVSVLCFLVLIVSAPIIGNFYNDPGLREPLIVAGLVLIINSFQITQMARLMSEMRHKQNTMYGFISTLVGSVIGIVSAYIGFGIWALIIMQISRSAINTALLWLFEGFYFKLTFSKTSFTEMYSFGKNTTLSSLLNKLFDNIYQLILAKYFSISQAGFYYQAKKIQDLPGVILKAVIQTVVFSGLAKLQDDKERFYSVYNRIVATFASVLGLMTLLLYFYAYDIVEMVLGPEWLETGLYIQLLSIASYFYVQENFNRVIFKIFNKTHIILNLEIAKKAIQSLTVVIGVVSNSLLVLLIGFIVTNAVSFFINFFYSRSVLGNFNKYEVFLTVKIFIVGMLILLGFSGVRANVQLLDGMSFLYLFLIVPSYFVSLQVFKVLDVRESVREFRKIFA